MTSFLGTEENFLALDAEWSSPDTAGVIVQMAGFEKTSSFGLGSALGPQAILKASHEVELFDAVLGFEPYIAAKGIATLAPLDVSDCDGASLAAQLFQQTAQWLERRKFVVTVGGEHTSIVGAVQAHCRAFSDVTVLQLDAHSDLREEYQGDPWSHACAMARVLDFHDHIVQGAIRSQERVEREVSEARGIPVFYAHDIHDREAAGEDWIGDMVRATRPQVYISLDCDALDPAVVPATGTPEPGGLTWRQVDRLFARLCAEREVIGLDVSELAPISGDHRSEFTMAKLIYRILGRKYGGR